LATDKGDKGDKGDQGIPGLTGLASLPIYQNKKAAIAAGHQTGSFWVDQGSGQVYRRMDLNRDCRCFCPSAAL